MSKRLLVREVYQEDDTLYLHGWIIKEKEEMFPMTHPTESGLAISDLVDFDHFIVRISGFIPGNIIKKYIARVEFLTGFKCLRTVTDGE